MCVRESVFVCVACMHILIINESVGVCASAIIRFTPITLPETSTVNVRYISGSYWKFTERSCSQVLSGALIFNSTTTDVPYKSRILYIYLEKQCSNSYFSLLTGSIIPTVTQ